MTPKIKAIELYNLFLNLLPDAVEIHDGTIKDVCKSVIDLLIERDKQWFEMLSENSPANFSKEDYKKSIIIFQSLKEEIQKL